MLIMIYVNFRATIHKTDQRGKLKTLGSYFGNDHILVGNRQVLAITYIGNASLNTLYGKLVLENILVVPNIK